MRLRKYGTHGVDDPLVLSTIACLCAAGVGTRGRQGSRAARHLAHPTEGIWDFYKMRPESEERFSRAMTTVDNLSASPNAFLQYSVMNIRLPKLRSCRGYSRQIYV